MTDEGTVNLPTAVTKAYDLLLWLINHVGKFPRSHRFVLGDQIESRMLTVNELRILAEYARGKRAICGKPIPTELNSLCCQQPACRVEF